MGRLFAGCLVTLDADDALLFSTAWCGKLPSSCPFSLIAATAANVEEGNGSSQREPFASPSETSLPGGRAGGRVGDKWHRIAASQAIKRACPNLGNLP